jgi:hypothetical protein
LPSSRRKVDDAAEWIVRPAGKPLKQTEYTRGETPEADGQGANLPLSLVSLIEIQAENPDLDQYRMAKSC